MTLLRATGVAKQFGGLRCLDDVTFTVAPGEIVGIIGPNGAGKSTLFNIISGFLKPSAGTVHYRDRDITGMPPHLLAAGGIVRTFQTLNLFQGISALENVMVSLQLRGSGPIWADMLGLPRAWRNQARQRRQAREWLDFVGLSAVAERPAGELPFGQQRLLDTARALATEPQLLMLDEPVSGLSTPDKEAYGRLLERIQAMGITIILVEHDMPVVMSACHRVLVLNSGRMIAEGTPAQVQANPAVRTAYLGEEVAG